MGVFSGPADWWTDGTNEGRTHIATKGVIQDGIVLNLDAGASTAYPGSGTTWTDLSGGSNNGTLTNGPTFSSADGGSIVFDGTNDYIDLGDTFDDIIAGADKKFSMEIWINPDTVSESSQHLISKQGDSNFSENNREFYIKLSNDEVSSFASFNPSTAQSRQYTTSSANLTAGSWHHIVLVYDGSIDAAGRFTFYVNGQNEAATVTYSNGSWGDIQDTAARFAIGAMVGANVANSPLAPYNGKVSNAKVYSRLLTAAEVEQNYDVTKGRFGI